MANNSLNHRVCAINLSVDIHTELFEQLTKAVALAEITTTEGFLHAKPSVAHDYLWALRDIIVQARALCDEGN